MKRPLSIVHIFIESRLALREFYKRAGAFGALIPRSLAAWYIHRKYFPNNLLLSLQRRGDIRYLVHCLPHKAPYTADDVKDIPAADVWFFSLINCMNERAFDDSFFRAAEDRARRQGICPINLVSHLDDGRLPLAAPPPEFPKLAKFKGNGMVGDYNENSFFMLKNQQDEDRWRAGQNGIDIDQYVVQPFLTDKRNDATNGIYCIERWIHIDGDLTIGLRRARNPIVKQPNSLTTYLRDARMLSGGEFDAMRTFISGLELRRGCMPLSFHYHADNDFWDRRYTLLNDLADRTGFVAGSVDAIQLTNDQIVISDYNEHTLESAHEDLQNLWADHLIEMIRRRLTPPPDETDKFCSRLQPQSLFMD